MKLTFSGKHTAFILIGFFLCMASVLCSSFDSVIYSSFNGWTGEGSYGTSNFMTDIILRTGIFEVLLPFSNGRFGESYRY